MSIGIDLNSFERNNNLAAQVVWQPISPRYEPVITPRTRRSCQHVVPLSWSLQFKRQISTVSTYSSNS